MARNNQLMYWEGTLDEFRLFMVRHSRRRGENFTYLIYKTGDPNVWVWSKKQIPEHVTSALRIQLHDAIRIRGNLEAVQ